MKNFVKEFCKRGLLFAWGGPFIMAIVFYCLQMARVVTMLSVNEVVLGIVSSTIMAFIAAGISVVYHIERLPKPMAALIQMAVLYFDYLAVYLINGWLPISQILLFSIIYIAGFLVIWLSIYIGISIKVKKVNNLLGKQER